jgi:trans-aconitate 2-methyltransferase
MSAWDPALYLTFSAERTRPAVELAARVLVTAPRSVVDLGCGPGNSTAVLRSRWPSAFITGVDNDFAMLEAAERTDSTVRWVRADANTWAPTNAYDVVFSNALLQWLPDHASTVRRFFAAVAPGGALALQLPMHLASSLHRHVLEVAGLPRWKSVTRGARRAISRHSATFYYDALCSATPQLDLWETEYHHVVSNPQAIVDWIRGTGLRPFLSVLATDAERRAFEAALLARVTASYPTRPDGRVLFPFRRLFVIAYRPPTADRGP